MKTLKTLFIPVTLCVCCVLSSCVSRNARKVIKQIDSIGIVNHTSKSALESIEKDYLALTDEEKAQVDNYDIYEKAKETFDDKVREYLGDVAKDKAVSYVRERIKENLKSPASYREYSCDAQRAYISDTSDDEFMTFKIKYGATNSFGAEVTKTVSAAVNFSVDIENQTVVITDALIF